MDKSHPYAQRKESPQKTAQSQAYFASPTAVLITDRTDLDEQLAGQFTNAKHFIGDQNVVSVESRAHLRELLAGRQSGGVFLTTIRKFTEGTELLSRRANIVCISDEAHRSQVNLEQKVRVTDADYLAKIEKIKPSNTKIKLLQLLLARVIGQLRRVNQVKGIDFTKNMQALVARYNERD